MNAGFSVEFRRHMSLFSSASLSKELSKKLLLIHRRGGPPSPTGEGFFVSYRVNPWHIYSHRQGVLSASFSVDFRNIKTGFEDFKAGFGFIGY